LKEAGIVAGGRQDWPIEVLRKVYHQLVSETPKDLIYREIWTSCSTPAEIWGKTASHARSVAVMSVIGYMIGLGDR
jgi:PI-3-kinase-related kinase SMG-1